MELENENSENGGDLQCSVHSRSHEHKIPACADRTAAKNKGNRRYLYDLLFRDTFEKVPSPPDHRKRKERHNRFCVTRYQPIILVAER
jgi:hypothetical protein